MSNISKGGKEVIDSNKNDYNIDGIELLGENVKKSLKKCGKGVKIRPLAKIAVPEVVELDDYAIIDDFVFIAGGQGIKIGKFVHISSFCSVIGGGKLEMEDFSGLSAGCRIITGSDDFSGKSLTNPCVPWDYKPFAYQGYVKICKHAILGTNVIVHTNVTIGEGCSIGSNTLVTKDLEPWGIYIGTPAKRIKDRQKDLLELESRIMDNYYSPNK